MDILDIVGCIYMKIKVSLSYMRPTLKKKKEK